MMGVLRPAAAGRGAVATAVLLAATSCAGGEGARAEAPTTVDSAGVIIALTPAAVADAPIGWSVAAAPDLILGDGGGGNDEFSRISGVRQVPDGRIAVLDRGSLSVRLFDSEGTWVETVGRDGEGPGEYALPSLIPAPLSDSLMVWDVGLKRITVVRTNDPSDPGVMTPVSWVAAVPPQGMADEGSALLRNGKTVVIPVPPGVNYDTLTYSWVHPLRGGAPKAVAELPNATLFHEVRANGVRVGHRIPFTAMPSAAVRESEAWITSGEAPEVRVYDLDGRLIRIARVDRDPMPVTEETWEQYIAARPNQADVIDDMPRQETVPAFTSLLVDDLGLVWASWYVWDPARPTTWTVFDPDGRALGTVETPAGFDVQQVGADFMLGLARTDLDVEQVRRYRLDRSSPP